MSSSSDLTSGVRQVGKLECKIYSIFPPRYDRCPALHHRLPSPPLAEHCATHGASLGRFAGGELLGRSPKVLSVAVRGALPSKRAAACVAMARYMARGAISVHAGLQMSAAVVLFGSAAFAGPFSPKHAGVFFCMINHQYYLTGFAGASIGLNAAGKRAPRCSGYRRTPMPQC